MYVQYNTEHIKSMKIQTQ